MAVQCAAGELPKPWDPEEITTSERIIVSSTADFTFVRSPDFPAVVATPLDVAGAHAKQETWNDAFGSKKDRVFMQPLSISGDGPPTADARVAERQWTTA